MGLWQHDCPAFCELLEGKDYTAEQGRNQADPSTMQDCGRQPERIVPENISV